MWAWCEWFRWNDNASRCGVRIVRWCRSHFVVKDRCGCIGDSAMSLTFFKNDVTSFDCCT